jgi:hypothetical protein
MGEWCWAARKNPARNPGNIFAGCLSSAGNGYNTAPGTLGI